MFLNKFIEEKQAILILWLGYRNFHIAFVGIQIDHLVYADLNAYA